MADLFRDEEPTVVIGPESMGVFLGSIVAVNLGVGLIQVRKDPTPSNDNYCWVVQRTPPDYQDRNLKLGFRRELIDPTDRVLMVDDWIATGGQAQTIQAMVGTCRATWLGVAVIVDGLAEPGLRRALELRSLINIRGLSR